MEFIKNGKNYIIKNSNGRVVTEKEKLELENKELVLKDITGCNCQQETTKKIAKNKKKIKEIEKESIIISDYSNYDYLEKKENIEYTKRKEPIKFETTQKNIKQLEETNDTALTLKGVSENDSIEETNITTK